MRLCGLGIGQPVAVQTVEVQRPLVVCKSWPFKKMELDGIFIPCIIEKNGIAKKNFFITEKFNCVLVFVGELQLWLYLHAF